MMRLDKVTGVFTDESIPKEAETALLENKVLLNKVPAAEPDHSKRGSYKWMEGRSHET